jgi:hypothetical protein
MLAVKKKTGKPSLYVHKVLTVGTEENVALTFRKEHRLRAFENKGHRRIFGPKMDEVRGEWRKLHN